MVYIGDLAKFKNFMALFVLTMGSQWENPKMCKILTRGPGALMLC